MTPEEILISLYELRKELESKAVRRYQMGIGLPYTDELKEIDEQIKKAEKRTKISNNSILVAESKKESNDRIKEKEDKETSKESNIAEHKDRQAKINGIIELQNSLGRLSKVDSIKLRILEKIKYEWDIYPNKDRYTISQSKYWSWIREFGIDDLPQFKNFILNLKKEGLIDRFDFIPDYI